ncbi:hypothetical protein F5X98DRAFT_389210 [Xylaria grammica]|nr:hypothetical protein F5X98DRAFT_389210 [Xylaria grammica]
MPNNSDPRGGREHRRRRRRGPRRRGRGAGVPGTNGGTNTGQRDRNTMTISATGRQLGQMAHRLLEAHPNAAFTLSFASTPSSTSTPAGAKRSSTDDNNSPDTKKKTKREVPAAAPTSTSRTAATRPSRSEPLPRRSSSAAGICKPIASEVPCENCAVRGHFVEGCREPCGACGDTEHTIIGCDSRPWACVCSAAPRHLLANCNQNCAECMELSDSDDCHPVSKCPVLCHYCLSRGHTMADCKKPRTQQRQCARCSAGSGEPQYHLPSECVHNCCPVISCKDRACCTTHCVGCGWDLAALKGIMDGRKDTAHECQFTKIWGGRTNAGNAAVNLVCRKNSDHKFLSVDLAIFRDTCAQKISWKYGLNGAIINWPTECPACRELLQAGRLAAEKGGR